MNENIDPIVSFAKGVLGNISFMNELVVKSLMIIGMVGLLLAIIFIPI